MPKTYTIEMTKDSSGSVYTQSGTMAELVEAYSYTLECGASWSHEKGNKKINRHPKTGKSLVNNLNNAVNNTASNGYAGKHYTLVS